MSQDRLGPLSPMDELRLMDMHAKEHEHDMRKACSCDPLDTSGDPIDGVPREHPGDLREPVLDVPDIL